MAFVRRSWLKHLACGTVLMLTAAGCGSSEEAGTGGMPGTGGSPGGCGPCDRDGAELAGNGCDDNCNTLVDEAVSCDQTLQLDGLDSVDGARAMDLCKGADTELDWGVVRVSYTLPAGESPPSEQSFELGHGLLTSFGSTAPRNGSHVLALSTGTARDVDDPNYQPPTGFDKGYISSQPTGFPVDIPACGDLTLLQPHDGIALEVEVRAPPNASGFAFDFAFLTADFSTLACSEFSDVFAVLVDPVPAQATAGNLVLDGDGNPISVNSSLLESCACDGGPPCLAGGLAYDCTQGTSFIEGTGFEQGGATGWLTTTAPVQPGSVIRLRFAIWDSGDGVPDSTVLIDNFRWLDQADGITTTRLEP